MQIMSKLDALNVVVSDYNINAPASILVSIADSFGNTQSKTFNAGGITMEDMKDLVHNLIGFSNRRRNKG